jgi:hypothetical protein
VTPFHVSTTGWEGTVFSFFPTATQVVADVQEIELSTTLPGILELGTRDQTVDGVDAAAMLDPPTMVALRYPNTRTQHSDVAPSDSQNLEQPCFIGGMVMLN